tara:strand:+ start:600 stop:2981 length:2382 start_codon:yes stop_codon:yes gene_type:complete
MKKPIRILKPLSNIVQSEEIKPLKSVKLYERISRVSLYILVFLLPLFFLPWTSSVLDFNKHALLGVLVFISFLAWLVKILISQKLELNLSRLNIPILFLLLIYGLSTVFSLWRYGSIWGWPLNVSAGFLTLLGLVLFYFLITNVFTKKEEVLKLLLLLVISAFIAGLLGLLQIFGKFLLPWDFTKITSFNTIGTVNSLSLFLASLLPLILVLGVLFKRLIKILLIVFALSIFVFLIIVNFWVSWMVLIAGVAGIFLFSMLNMKTIREGVLISLPMAILVIALFFLVFKISLPGLPPTPIEVSPSFTAEFNITKETFKDYGIPKILLGTGPGTFIYNYSKFKSPDLNQTLFWNTRFGKGASDVLDRLITTGVLGLFSWLALVVVFFWFGFKHLRKLLREEEKKSWLISLGVFTLFIGSVLGQFLYPLNLSSLFLFFFALAALGILEAKEKEKIKSWTLEPDSYLMVAISSVLVLVIVFGAGISFIGIQKHIAEARYLGGLMEVRQGQIENANSELLGAINLNSSIDTYWRDLSQLYLTRISQAQNAEQNQVFISNSVGAAKQATDLNPQSVANWSVRGFVYRNLIGLLGGAEDWALKSYEEALKLEPSNPYLFTEIGIVHTLKADLITSPKGKDEALQLALENFNKAISLKPDYASAHFRIALVYNRQGNTSRTITKLEETKLVAPFDVGLAFQLGLLYYQQENLNRAQAEFERAVDLSPNYSNAIYFLGLVYDRQGKKTDAIIQFNRIANLNPGNAEVNMILTNLSEGREALDGVTSGQPPIIEIPPEQLETE